MANNNCQMANYVEHYREKAIYIPMAILTIIVGGLTLALAIYMKLHKKMLYRLVMYQVIDGTAYGVFWLLNLVVKGSSSSWPVQTTVVESLLLFAAGVKLLLGVSLTVQIYVLAVIQRNFPKLELIYVTTSLLIPLALAATYGGVNYMNMYECDGRTLSYSNITMLSLSALLLAACCVCSLVVLLIVGKRAFRGSKISEPSYIERQHIKAACEMLPLFAYLLIFLAHILGVLTIMLYTRLSRSFDKRIERALTVLESSWGLVASLTFAVHLAVVMWVRTFCVKASIARHQKQTAYGIISDVR